MIEMSAIPLGVFWAMFAGAVLVLDTTLLLISPRYWQTCIAVTVLMTLFALLKRSPAITSEKDAIVIATIVVLSFATGLWTRLRSLRATMRSDPQRALNQLIGPDQALRFMVTIIATLSALFAAALLLLKGLAP